MATLDKKTVHKGLKVTSEENRKIIAVQKYHGIVDFSAMVLLLFSEEAERLEINE